MLLGSRTNRGLTGYQTLQGAYISVGPARLPPRPDWSGHLTSLPRPSTVARLPSRRSPSRTAMAKVLFADYDFPDIELERSLFAAAGVELATAQCRTEDAVIAAARDCAAILCQYAPVTERVAAALPGVGLVSRIGAGFDNIDTDACARHGLWVGNSPDYGVGEVATHALALVARDDAQHRRLPPRHRRRKMALRIVGQAAPRDQHDARHRRARPDRQADGARQPQRVQAGHRLRPVHHRRRLPGVRRARRSGAGVRARATSCRCTCRSTRRRAG